MTERKIQLALLGQLREALQRDEMLLAQVKELLMEAEAARLRDALLLSFIQLPEGARRDAAGEQLAALIHGSHAGRAAGAHVAVHESLHEDCGARLETLRELLEGL